ncbi:MAG: hypothetical protein L3J17_02655 [Candidatus Jettenia sp.]|nr:MAG: hypothetical protein L3J17_02655 [Candidatus Jettenia sp.]
MKHIDKILILISLIFCIAGCKTTGYTLRIKTEVLGYSEIDQMEAILENNGYDMESRGGNRSTNPNEVIIFFEKKFSREKVVNGIDPKDLKKYFEKIYNEERYWWVDVNLSYVKDISGDIVQHLRVDVYNQFIGGISPDLKAEINSIGDLLYQDLANKVGKEKVTIERREWGPPVIY